MADGLHTPGVVNPIKARLAEAGLIAVQGPGAMNTRTGVLHGPGTTALVTGTADTAPMAVLVAPHHWVTTRGSADGIYRGAHETAVRVSIAAAPASGSRIDVIYDKQSDANSTVTPDGSTAFAPAVVTGVAGAGKPALPVGAEELATVTVSAGATATNGAGVVIANTARQTTAHGAPIPVGTIAERDALPAFAGATAMLYAAATLASGVTLPAGTMFICDGTTWHTIARDDDTGWVSALSIGATAGTGFDISSVYVRRRMGQMFINGAPSKATWASGDVFLTMPTGWLPTRSIEMQARAGSTYGPIALNATGTFQTYQANTTGALGTSFAIVPAPVPLG